MRLVLPIPSSWQLVGSLWRIGDLAVEILPLAALPEHWPDAVAPLLARDLGAGQTVQRLSAADTTTKLGAPLHVELTSVVANGATVEERLVAVFVFGEWGGEVLVRSLVPGALAAHEAELSEVLAGARPDFGGQVAALEQVFVGFSGN